MARRRLFRKRENGEWMRENAYLAVSLFALAAGAVAWASIFDGPGSEAEFATTELVAGTDHNAASESPTVAENEASPTTSTAETNVPTNTAAPVAARHTSAPAPVPVPPAAAVRTETAPPVATTDAAAAPAVNRETKSSPPPVRATPRAKGQARDAGARRMAESHVDIRRHDAPVRATRKADSKPRASARSSRSVRYAMIDRKAGKRHEATRRARARPREQTLALATQAPRRARASEDYLDRPYSPPPAPVPMPGQRQQVAQAPKLDPAWKEEIERGLNKMECTRSFGAFGASRRIPTDC